MVSRCYCGVRRAYEDAVSEYTDRLDNTKYSCAGESDKNYFTTKAACVLQTGLEYASACNQARAFKNNPDNQDAWNTVTTTTVKLCPKKTCKI